MSKKPCFGLRKFLANRSYIDWHVCTKCPDELECDIKSEEEITINTTVETPSKPSVDFTEENVKIINEKYVWSGKQAQLERHPYCKSVGCPIEINREKVESDPSTLAITHSSGKSIRFGVISSIEQFCGETCIIKNYIKWLYNNGYKITKEEVKCQ